MGTNDFAEGNAVKRKVSTVLVHPYWNKGTYDNDLALLKMDKKVTFSTTLQPICLPTVNEKSFIGESCSLSIIPKVFILGSIS